MPVPSRLSITRHLEKFPEGEGCQDARCLADFVKALGSRSTARDAAKFNKAIRKSLPTISSLLHATLLRCRQTFGPVGSSKDLCKEDQRRREQMRNTLLYDHR